MFYLFSFKKIYHHLYLHKYKITHFYRNIHLISFDDVQYNVITDIVPIKILIEYKRHMEFIKNKYQINYDVMLDFRGCLASPIII